MIEFNCNNCASSFKVQDSYAGKTVRCMCCKHKITIPHRDHLEADHGLMELYDISDENDLPLEAKTAMQDESGSQIPRVINPSATKRIDPGNKNFDNAKHIDAIKPEHFWLQLPGCLFFAVNWPNIISTIFLIVGSLVMSFLFSFFGKDLNEMLSRGNGYRYRSGAVFVILTLFTISAYMFLLSYIMRATSKGSDKLVSMIRLHDKFDGLYELKSFLYATAWAAIPALLSFIPLGFYLLKSSAPQPLVNSCFIAAAVIIALFWPMSLLTISMHGLEISVIRHDLLAKNALAAAPQYLLVCCVCAIAIAATTFAAIQPGAFFFDWMEENGLSCGQQWANRLIFILTALYLPMTAMRVIGVYYRTCKEKLGF